MHALNRRLALLAAGVLTAALVLGFAPRGVRSVLAGAQPQAVTPFLYPPFPGDSYQSSIFDHSNPNYSQSDGLIVLFNGFEAYRTCPNPPPPGTPPPGGVCDQGGGYYWSYSLGDWVYYNGHDGVDYAFSNRPLFAAAEANQVMYAGWQNPQDHRAGLGIYVRLRHPNGYQTYYGHMNSVAVQTCPTVGCASLARGEVLGISGTTGNSTGPHLHFRVNDPQGRAVDPYGWTGPGSSPLAYQQKESLWVQYPSVIPFWNKRILPTGDKLDFPAPPLGGTIVDNSDSASFTQDPPGCWRSVSTAPNYAQNGNLNVTTPNTSAITCVGRWRFPPWLSAGMYAVYVRIPNVNATSEGALYSIVHLGRTDRVVVNQAAFPSGTISDGWVYLGKYEFGAGGGEYVELPNRTQDNPSLVDSLELGADAVQFVRVGAPPVPVTPSITPTPSITFTPSITPTPSVTRTPTATFTPSRTPTPSNTPTPSRTPTATSTRTPTATITPSQTRWPTLTRTPSRTPTITRTPTPSRTPTATWTPTSTRTPTVTRTPTPSRTPTPTVTPTRTRTPTPTRTSTRTPGPSPTRTLTPTRTFTPTLAPTATRWPTLTFTPSRTPTITRTPTPSRTPTATWTPTSTRTPTVTRTPTPSRTLTRTPGPSPTRTLTPTRTSTPTRWPSATPRPSDTRWPTATPSP